MGNWDEHGKRSRSEQQLPLFWKRRKISGLAHDSHLLGVFEVGKRSLALPIESFFQSSPLEAGHRHSTIMPVHFPVLSPLPRPLQGPQRTSVHQARNDSVFTKEDGKKAPRECELVSEFQRSGFSQEHMLYPENMGLKIIEDMSDVNINLTEDLSKAEACRRAVHEYEGHSSSLLKDPEWLGTNFECRDKFEWHEDRNKERSTSLQKHTEVSSPVNLWQMTQDKQPIWKQLCSQVCQRDFRIKQLDAEILLLGSKLSDLQVTRKGWPKSKSFQPTEHELQSSETFATLSKEEEDRVDNALSSNAFNIHGLLVIHEDSNIELTRAALQCLLPGRWLNDEVINLYLELLKERELREPKKFLKCHFFNTFFYNKLYKDKRSYDFKAVRRWTSQKKLRYSLLDCDKIFVPIHKEVHWCLAVINIRDKKLEYLDSLVGEYDKICLQVLARYITDEAKDKSGKDLEANTWEQIFPQDIPRQLNGCDCGMFMVKYIDFHSQDIPLQFTQEHMEYFRRRMVLELLMLKAN